MEFLIHRSIRMLAADSIDPKITFDHKNASYIQKYKVFSVSVEVIEELKTYKYLIDIFTKYQEKNNPLFLVILLMVFIDYIN